LNTRERAAGDPAGGGGDQADSSITVEIQAAGKPLETRIMECGGDGREILGIVKELELPPDILIPVKNGSPVPITETVRPGEKIRLISVVSGG